MFRRRQRRVRKHLLRSRLLCTERAFTRTSGKAVSSGESQVSVWLVQEKEEKLQRRC